MKQSQYFLKTSKTKPAEDISVNAILLEQGGFVQKVMAGVYTFLPLGQRVLVKIENIVREEMNALGAGEMFMPALHPKVNWEATGRWSGLDVLFKIKSQHGYEYALGATHEEIVTPSALPIINSYKDLPLAVYQIQTKFRDEPRAKSGLLRGREFRMKDLYSFHASEQDLDAYYEKAVGAYKRVFNRIGLNALYTEASGGTFSKFSHEFQVEVGNGEDVIFVCEKCNTAKNKEVYEEGVTCTTCGESSWREVTASEVGNIFKLKTKYSDSFNLKFTDNGGKQQPVLMGCYGIGTSRLMGVVVEKFNDEKGIVWPDSIAPFKVHLLGLNLDDDAVRRETEKIYSKLTESGVEVLYDDRDQSAGVKFADSDLIGITFRIVVSKKTLTEGSVEVKKRNENEAMLVKVEELAKLMT
jgi:prolyl-tRNA synthetase